MNTPQKSLQDFRDILSQTLELIETGIDRAAPPEIGVTDPLPSLLRQCEMLMAAAAPPPIRTIHHLACTGGTLISKCIAASPGTILFSEVDPLSLQSMAGPTRPFFPTDMIADLCYSPRIVDRQVKIDYFVAGLKSLNDNLARRGQQIVLRDHSHSHFCRGAAIPDRPTVAEMAAMAAPVLSIVTVRHPLDSYLSITENKWVHFAPATLNEYCRRTLVFLVRYADAPVFRYEDFTTAPQDVLSRMLDALALESVPDFETLIPLFRLSGDSGRKEARIWTMPRRPVPENIAKEARNSKAYRNLCARLDYRPEIEASDVVVRKP